jgi:hypothetical protein
MNKVTAAMMAAMVIATSGCATSRPYTKGERIAFAGAVAGQALDMGTTAYFTYGVDGVEEGNPIFANAGDGELMASLFITKAALLGGGYLLGEWKPNWRTRIYSVIGCVGAGAGVANMYTINEYGD